MPTVSHTIDIDASADRVWGVLADTAAYPEWNPFLVEIDGELVRGSRPAVTLVLSGTRRRITPTVTVVEPERRLAWLGRLLVPGVFDGLHSFEIRPLTPGSTRFTQSERFSGLLVPVLRGMVRSAEAGFAAMNTALAERASAR